MKLKQAFELLELFKTKAKKAEHLYDAYHGKPDGVHLWFIYDFDGDDGNRVASFRFEDYFQDDEFMVEIIVREAYYQFIDYAACKDLINKISYKQSHSTNP